MVTGGVGFVGTTLCRVLSNKGYEVCVVDDFSYGKERMEPLADLANTHIHDIDMLDATKLQTVMDEFSPELVVHLAAIHFIPTCNEHPVKANVINVIGTERVLQCASKVPSIKRTITTSSAAVYPISDDSLSHDFTPAPTDIYGITKATNEWQSQQYASGTGVKTVSVRLFNVFGQGETNPHLIPEIIEQIKDGKYKLELGNVEPKRSYIHVEDVADAFLRLLECELNDTYTCVNLGHEEEASVKDVVNMMAKATGLPLEIVQDPAKVRKSDRMYLRCDSSNIHKLTGWKPSYSIEDGLVELLKLERLIK